MQSPYKENLKKKNNYMSHVRKSIVTFIVGDRIECAIDFFEGWNVLYDGRRHFCLIQSQSCHLVATYEQFHRFPTGVHLNDTEAGYKLEVFSIKVELDLYKCSTPQAHLLC